MNKGKTNADKYRFSRLMYIFEAALEYFISIAVGTVYLARITTYIGMSDSLTGILSSFVSLGCGFQLVAIFVSKKKPVKTWVTTFHIVSQSMFAALYIVPVLKLSIKAKTVLFVAMLLSAQILHNVINPPKINWYMSLVDDKKRGSFTASKEMVSLIGGMAFSYALGYVIDFFNARGEQSAAFTLCGIGLFVLMILHSVTLLLSKEKPVETVSSDIKAIDMLKSTFKDKTLLKIMLVSVLWSVANYSTISFTGTYQAKELAFSAAFSSVIIMVGSLIRALVSKPMGRFADKTSFVKMLCLCLIIAAAAYLIHIFITPISGKYLYPVYYVLYCIGMAGINSATMNLIFDYIDKGRRTSALALNHSLSGFAGFFTTLILSMLVGYIQKNGNEILGVRVYAQQVTAAISFAVTAALVIYLFAVVRKIPRKTKDEKTENKNEIHKIN